MTNPLCSILAALLASLTLVGCGAPVSTGSPEDAGPVADGAVCPPDPPEYAVLGALPPTWCLHTDRCPPTVGPGGRSLGSLWSGRCVYICPPGWQTCGGACDTPWSERCP